MPPNPTPQDLQALGLPNLPHPHPSTSNPANPATTTIPLFQPPAPPHLLPPLKAANTHALRTARNSLSMTLDSWDALTLRSLAAHTSLPATREVVGAKMRGAGLVELVAGREEEVFRARGVWEGPSGRRWAREGEEGEGVTRATRQDLEDGVTGQRENRLMAGVERDARAGAGWDAGLLLRSPGSAAGERRRWKGLREEIVRERRRRREELVKRAREAGEVVRGLEREGEASRRVLDKVGEGEWESWEGRVRDVESRIEGVRRGVRAEYEVYRARVGTRAERAGAGGGGREGDGDTVMGGVGGGGDE